MPQPIGFDTSRTFVRVVEHRPDGFVEFHFSIGEPSLFVEMLLTEPAFAEFCALHRTELLDPIVHSDTENEPDVDHVVDDFTETVTEIEQDVELVEEEAVFAPGVRPDVDGVYHLKRELIEFKRCLTPLAAPLQRAGA